MIKEPVCIKGTWVVELSDGYQITFGDGETAQDFYLLNKAREEQTHGNSSKP
jgi:hypothetical protein